MSLVLEFVDALKRHDPSAIGILVAVLVGILTIGLLFYLKSTRSGRSSVLLLGICGAGKTLLFTWLTHGKFKETYTSIKTNHGNYTAGLKNKQVKIVDLPGHERLRNQSLEENKSQARAVVFVIDSLTFQKEIKDVAEFLYTVLSDNTVLSRSLPILIACNKQDQTLAKGSKVIQSNLEKEMNTLRVTKAAALQGTDNTSNNNSYLGKRNKPFEFSDLKPMSIEFVECSIHGKTDEEADFSTITRWLDRVA
ncbi:signal recognition particle receptor subunit beta-like [Gigantopelta aegis]|uniref:signal recognition particle receptor subunit beta-like n=1 Tax=Gigantopelta aegis TaxID=1735272 RepID=UPI001B889CB2|nr:signal recognition particle receptor subunit beta-like [Gigantopelta aegis]